MNTQKNRIILGLFLLLVLGTLFYRQAKSSQLGTRVEAVGNLLITYLGIPLDGPVFEVVGMLPGDCKTRLINVDNSGLESAKVAVKSRNEIDPDNLSTQLHFRISAGAVDLYGGTATTGAKLVSDFFADSTSFLDGIPLSTLAPGANVDYQFEVCFDPAAGNQYQNTQTIFDLVFGERIVPVELPEVCSALEGLVTQKIVGTEADDFIIGTSASEYIVGLGGNDTIQGGGGDDCIIGGEGNDDIDAGSGRDIITGNQGNDHLDGHADDDVIFGHAGEDFIEGKDGNDLIFAGQDNDRVEAGSDNDLVYGDGGDDILEGGSGNDEIHGEAGNDDISGNSGNDFLYGEGGNDLIHGNSGNDYLDGGPGIDTLDGDSDTDECYNGETVTSCFP